MKNQKKPYLLKVLSGPNAGAKIQLGIGNYIVGNSTENEIIFHDKHIAPRHLKLLVTTKGIFVEPLANPVFISGNDIGIQNTRLRPYQVITLGKVNFAIGSATQKWPVIKRPTFQTAHRKGQQKTKVNQISNSKPAKWKYLFAGLALLLFANIFYFKSDISDFANSFESKKSQVITAQKTIDDLGLANIKVENNAKDVLRITGYVKSKQEKQLLLNKIANLDKPVTYRVWIAKELVEQANYIASSYGESDIQFSMETNGELIADGYIKNASQWNNARQSILNDIDGVKNIQDEGIDSLQQQLEKFRAYLSKESFKKRVTLAIKEGKITVSGELTDKEISRWKKVREQFFSQYRNAPDLVENLQSSRSRFTLAIRGVSVGKVPFITSKDDKKYLIGSHLGKGYFVKSITPDKILLQHNDIEIPVYFGKKDNDNATNAK